MRRSLKILSRLMLILSKLIRVLFFILFLSNTAPILERPEGSLAGGGAVNVIEKKLKQRARRAVAKIVAERQGMIGGCASEVKPERCLDGIDFRCKIVDLGNLCWANKPIAEEIQTRQYRAPEVILQSGYSFPVDMWSFACTAFELATGEMIFAPKPGPGFSEDAVLHLYRNTFCL
ncbi:putative protein kinase CMGC-SRPK family [Helianthus annuus]|nr:putative protein kinase CMGC-SRPK family [Helianthus annuus]